MRRIIPHTRLGPEHCAVHLPRSDGEFVELCASNSAKTRCNIDVVFGGQTFNLRIRNVVASPAFGDIICDEHGDALVYLETTTRALTYSHHPLHIRGGVGHTREYVRPGDVCILPGCSAVAVHSSSDGITFDGMLPDDTYDDWCLVTRDNISMYRNGAGTISTTEADYMRCTEMHLLSAGDIVVAEVGGRHMMRSVATIIDAHSFAVNDQPTGWTNVQWWHIPTGTEIHVAPLGRSNISENLKIKDINFFGEASAGSPFASSHGMLITRAIDVGMQMTITLRPNAQRTRLLPCVPVGDRSIVTCCTDGHDVYISGHISASSGENYHTFIR